MSTRTAAWSQIMELCLHRTKSLPRGNGLRSCFSKRPTKQRSVDRKRARTRGQRRLAGLRKPSGHLNLSWPSPGGSGSYSEFRRGLTVAVHSSRQFARLRPPGRITSSETKWREQPARQIHLTLDDQQIFPVKVPN